MAWSTNLQEFATAGRRHLLRDYFCVPFLLRGASSCSHRVETRTTRARWKSYIRAAGMTPQPARRTKNRHHRARGAGRCGPLSRHDIVPGSRCDEKLDQAAPSTRTESANRRLDQKPRLQMGATAALP